MPPKRGREKGRGAVGEGAKKVVTKDTKGATTCRLITPGPKYELKTLVGYKEHCISRYRNPAYTFSGHCGTYEVAEGPGPKYKIEERRRMGFSFGHAAKHDDIIPGPGPKYMPPSSLRGPFFSMSWKPKPVKITETPGPYYIKPKADAPAFSMGRLAPKKLMVTGGHYTLYDLNAVKPRAPKYTMAGRRELRIVSKSPGPIYDIPPVKLKPAFSFGVKYSECVLPYITECDRQC